MLTCIYFVYELLHICFVKAPIICGREPNASEEEKKLGGERSAELSGKVNQVIVPC